MKYPTTDSFYTHLYLHSDSDMRFGAAKWTVFMLVLIGTYQGWCSARGFDRFDGVVGLEKRLAEFGNGVQCVELVCGR